VNVLSAQGATAGEVTLDESIFGAKVSVPLMHQAVVAQLAAARAGTHKTKTRAEVRGGGAKPWRQKGTGRARHGSTREPQWKGGGTVFGPVPRDHSVSMPKKMKASALRSAMVKNTEGAISYNTLAYAMEQGLFAAEIKTAASRKSLRAVRIGTDSVGKTIAGAKIVGKGNDLVLDISSFYNPTQPDVYPIVLVTYEIVCGGYPDVEVGHAVEAFLQSAIGPGQSDLDQHGYIPMPPDFQARISKAVEDIS